jgi:hypothetical protein
MLLNQEQRDDLNDLLEHPGVKSLIIVLEDLTRRIEHDILKVQLTGNNDHELVITKARGEGARKLQVALARQLVKPSEKRKT